MIISLANFVLMLTVIGGVGLGIGMIIMRVQYEKIIKRIIDGNNREMDEFQKLYETERDELWKKLRKLGGDE